MLNDFGKYFMNRVSVEECQKLSVRSIDVASLISSPIEINDQLIELTWTKCNYGGEMVWFLCPACIKRVGMLYRKPLNNVFLCRQCLNLTYYLRRFHRSPCELFIKSINQISKVDKRKRGK